MDTNKLIEAYEGALGEHLTRHGPMLHEAVYKAAGEDPVDNFDERLEKVQTPQELTELLTLVDQHLESEVQRTEGSDTHAAFINAARWCRLALDAIVKEANKSLSESEKIRVTFSRTERMR